MPLKPFAATLAALALSAAMAMPAGAADFTDAAGRHLIVPDRINRVMAAEPTADVLIAVLAPQKLVGRSEAFAGSYIPPRVAHLPVIGRLSGPGPTAGPEAIIRHHPDIVIDSGPISLPRIAFAEQMQAATGIPYVLVDSEIERIPGTLRAIGAILGVRDRAEDLATFSQNAIASVHGRLLIQPTSQRPRIYFGEAADGLLTPLPGSPDGEVVDEEGVLNVALTAGLGTDARVTRAQLLQWDPEIIIAAHPAFYSALLRDRFWRRLSAVRNQKVCLMPHDPFGWIDEPPGVNRIIGLLWLSGAFFPGPTQEDLRTSLRDFYDKFYGAKLTDPQLEALVKSACVPAVNPMQSVNLPLLGAPPTPGPGQPGMLPGAAPNPDGAAPGGALGVSPGVNEPGRRGLMAPQPAH